MKSGLTITKEPNETTLTLRLEGRIDTTTAPQLDEAIKASIDSIRKLILDFSLVEYISSAGLRVLLATQKVMSKKDGLEVHHITTPVAEVFEVTGFDSILTIL